MSNWDPSKLTHSNGYFDENSWLSTKYSFKCANLLVSQWLALKCRLRCRIVPSAYFLRFLARHKKAFLCGIGSHYTHRSRFLILVKSTAIGLYLLFSIDLEPNAEFLSVPNQSKYGKYNLISGWFNKISKRFLCVYSHPKFILFASIQIAKLNLLGHIKCSIYSPLNALYIAH